MDKLFRPINATTQKKEIREQIEDIRKGTKEKRRCSEILDSLCGPMQNLLQKDKEYVRDENGHPQITTVFWRK